MTLGSGAALFAGTPRAGSWWQRRVRVVLLACALVGGLLGCGKSSESARLALRTTTGETCHDGAAACGDACVQLSSSADHCGSCENACPGGAICDRGHCRTEAEGCSAPALLCGRDCADTASDEAHCGSCDNRCPSDASCRAGACACPGALTACGDQCVDTLQDERNCGACGQACVSTQTCESGQCQCPGGTELCASTQLTVVDGNVSAGAGAQSCVNTQSDAQHCGGCGNACTGGQICDQGSCECPAGQTLCNGTCADTSSSLANCGSCGNACTGGQTCSAGACACPSGQTFCGGTCVDLQSDSAHCGSCDVACSLGQGCASGVCESGAPGDDGCQGLAQNLTISQVAAYQTVKVTLANNGQAVANPNPGMVAKRPTLFRVFVTPGAGWVQRELSARLFLQDGDAKELTQYSKSTLTIAAASTDDDRSSTFEFVVPAERVTADTQFAVEIVECGSGTGAAASPRYPATGGADLAAIDAGGLKLHLVPLRANGLLPDVTDQALNLYKTAFLDTYPISAIDVTVGDPVDVADATDWANNLDQMRALRQREAPAAEVYYYGLLKPANSFRQFCGNGCVAGIGYVAQGRQTAPQRAAMGLAYADQTAAFTMLHEVGHNHGRNHAPCVPQGGQITGVDANFPQANGSTGGYGYNALGDQLLPPTFTDIMGYCQNQWFSAYTYGGILSTVMTVNRVQASEIPDPARLGDWRVLIVDEQHGARWGVPLPAGSEAAGEEEPAFVYDASGALLETVSVYRTQLSDMNAASVQVPAPRNGWRSIEVSGAPPIQFAP
jgi:hypothetical protein